MIELQEHIPWWQRELNARLARRALRRQALRRMVLQILGAAALTVIGVLILMALGQDARGRLAHSMRKSQRLAIAANAPANTGARHVAPILRGKQPVSSAGQMGQGPSVATTEITGHFYASDGRCTYDTPSTQVPLFVAHFPTINFTGRPFTDYGATAGQPNIVATHARDQVGLGRLNHFNAAFIGSLVVHQPGDVSFTFLVDDVFNLGVGAGASRVRGTLSNPPVSGVTALQHLPVVGSFNQGHLQATTSVTVHFPRPGSYPYELDYA